MLKSQIKVGKEYAYREKRTTGTPFQRVRIIEHIRGNKWKAEWVDLDPGLIHYVESGQLIVPWKENKAFLKDEANAEALREHNQRQGFKGDSPIVNALVQVFESVGEQVQFYHGTLSGPPEAIERLKARAGMDPKVNSPAAYLDRDGTLHLLFDEALELGRRFCTVVPSPVLVGVEATEREWERDARRGEDYIVGLLNEYRASWGILRQWAGYDAAVAQREAEIQRLERLVWDTVYALQKAGRDKEAARLGGAIERGR